MRIGIVTFYRADNCGAVLQCYALYKYLTDLGNNVEVIDYRTEEIEKHYRVYPKLRKNLYRLLISYSFTLTHLKEVKSKVNKFNSFRNLIKTTKSYTKGEMMSNSFDKYDLIISGSDQLWSPYITGGIDEVYYLNLKGCFKKATYAMSMGNISAPDFQGIRFRELVKTFDHISMRECDAASFISGIVGRSVPQVIDPTLLLSADQWECMLDNVKLNVPKKYIFLYYIAEDDELLKVAEHLANKLDITIIHANVYRKKVKKLNCNMVSLTDIGPLDFVYLIRNAFKVVTSSFHGTAFSCVFRKDIHLLLPKGTGARVKSICEMFGISNRIYSSYEDFVKKNGTKEDEIIYDTNRFYEMYNDSSEYLKKITSRIEDVENNEQR